jgi:hypothetical protein
MSTAITDAWRKYYGRDPQDSEARQYLGNGNYRRLGVVSSRAFVSEAEVDVDAFTKRKRP